MKNPISLEEYLQIYLDLLAFQRSSKRTIESCNLEVRFFFNFIKEQGITNIRKISRKEIDHYQTWLYYYRNSKDKGLTTRTQTIKLSVLRCFFKALVSGGYLSFNPAVDIQLPRQNYRLPQDILNAKEMAKLLATPDLATLYGYRDRTMLEVFYATGLRTTELTSLEIKDLDLANSFLLVREGKGLKDRTVPLTAIAVSFLTEYLSSVRSHLVTDHSKDLVFLTKSGRAFDRSAIQKKLKAISKRAKIKKNVTARSLRSTMATELLKGRADIRKIQEILGHKSLATTQIYARVVKTDLKRVHNRTHPWERSRGQG